MTQNGSHIREYAILIGQVKLRIAIQFGFDSTRLKVCFSVYIVLLDENKWLLTK